MEVRQILVNVVGIVSSEDERYQIENIAKAFVINERMKSITENMEPVIVSKKLNAESAKLKNSKNIINKSLSSLTVKGLN